ncbi:MAG: RNA polymerase sigma factor [Eggerthellales bacterium]|nr:RNA polymerase sigma factor [Eggerthellales bacterium]
MRSAQEIERAIACWGDDVWRVCVVRCVSYADAQDVFQETFLKYATHTNVSFQSQEHVKAWLLRVAMNACTDVARRNARRAESVLDEGAYWPAAEEDQPDRAMESQEGVKEVLKAIQSLDDPPRTPVYLAIVEEMPAPQIAQIMGAPVNTVYSWISRGKKQLRKMLGR